MHEELERVKKDLEDAEKEKKKLAAEKTGVSLDKPVKVGARYSVSIFLPSNQS